MVTQITSTSDDWTLKVESKGFVREYDRSELDEKKVLCIDHRFAETGKILLTYRLNENEKICRLLIPKCKDTIKREDTDDHSVIAYCWTPINFAGIFEPGFEIKTKDNRVKKYTLRLDVLSKFDEGGNSQNFIYMLNSIRRKHLEIFNLFNPSHIPKSAGKFVPPTPLEQFKVLEANMKKLENIVYQISLNPNKKLIKETRRDNFYALDMVDADVIYDIATQGGGLIKAPNGSIAPELQELLKDINGNRHLPDTVPVYRTAVTFNVFENQLLKRFLTLITICSKLVEKRFEQEKCQESEKWQIEKIDKYIMDCKDFHKKVQFMKRYSFLKNVTETDNIAYHTPVLQREANYMRFHEIFKDFIKMPFFDFSENLTLPILEIPVLYEYWAIIQIIDILCNMNDWKKYQHFIEKNEISYLFRLNEGNNSLFELSNNEKRISLFYQKKYETYTGRKVYPDITLEMRIDGKPSRILVLDPKYRSNLDSGDPNDPESAINKMHVYKEAIRGEDGKHIVEAAYAIYLGTTEEHPKYDTKDQIGGIKLFPDENDTICYEELRKVIENFINN
ncbi:PD-(D/E)XK nuclease superfamily protein [uncultured archaeon]|nr:PD-(D/E)XK nuclease superfamily protein [uncultured archaeon]